MEALQIINLPKNLEKDTTHRYGANQFKLHRLPTPRAGEVLGLVGTNGIGKSTALKVLAGKTKPNLGRFEVRIVFITVFPSFSRLGRDSMAFDEVQTGANIDSCGILGGFLTNFCLPVHLERYV